MTPVLEIKDLSTHIQLTRSVVDHQACPTPTRAHPGKSTGHAKRSQRQTAAADAQPTC